MRKGSVIDKEQTFPVLKSEEGEEELLILQQNPYCDLGGFFNHFSTIF